MTVAAPRTCTYCDTPLVNSRARNCNSPECVRLRNRDAKRKERGSRRYRCEACGRQLLHGRNAVNYCRGCRPPQYTEDERRARRRRRLAEAKLARAARGVPARRLWTQGACASCGASFMAYDWHWRLAQYCSDGCKARESVARRRAREAGAVVKPGRRVRIYEQDDWTCQLCDLPVTLSVDPYHPLRPCLDHIEALAGGGDHAPDNWQTAHRYCNSYKRDLAWSPEMRERMRAEVLLLIKSHADPVAPADAVRRAAIALRPKTPQLGVKPRNTYAAQGVSVHAGECMHRHRVEGPNVVACELPKRRRCLACARTRDQACSAAASGRPFDREAAREANYRSIMGLESAPTVLPTSFGLDGVMYEVDLDTKGAADLRRTLAKYIAVARPRRAALTAA